MIFRNGRVVVRTQTGARTTNSRARLIRVIYGPMRMEYFHELNESFPLNNIPYNFCFTLNLRNCDPNMPRGYTAYTHVFNFKHNYLVFNIYAFILCCINIISNLCVDIASIGGPTPTTRLFTFFCFVF